MFNVALAIAILVAIVVPTPRLLSIVTTPNDLQRTLGPFGAQLIILFVRYFVVAFLLYGIFRVLRLDRKFNFNANGATVLLVANVVVVGFGAVRVLASLVEGGGLGFGLSQLAMYVLFPCWLAIAIGLLMMWQKPLPPSHGAPNSAPHPDPKLPPI